MHWTFNWRDEDPAALILLFVILGVIFFTPWQSCDPTASLKYGPSPEVAEKPHGADAPAPGHDAPAPGHDGHDHEGHAPH